MILSTVEVCDPSLIDPPVIRDCPDHTIFSNKTSLQAPFDHVGDCSHLVGLESGVSITERFVSSSSPERIQSVEVWMLLVFGATFVL